MPVLYVYPSVFFLSLSCAFVPAIPAEYALKELSPVLEVREGLRDFAPVRHSSLISEERGRDVCPGYRKPRLRYRICFFLLHVIFFMIFFSIREER